MCITSLSRLKCALDRDATMSALRMTVMVIALTACAQSFAVGIPFSGNNCYLKQPPPDAGEDGVHGYPVKLYPRMRDIGVGYSGCLLSWAPTETGYEIVGVTRIEHGVAVGFWSPVDGRLCECRAGKADHDTCPAFRSITPRSMPSGCVARMMKAGGSVPGCGYE
jgi:hypothetical protein